MDDAAVMTGLVGSDRGFFFQNREPKAGQTRLQLIRGGQTHDAATDDRHVKPHGPSENLSEAGPIFALIVASRTRRNPAGRLSLSLDANAAGNKSTSGAS
jgi:hypothetical protein